MRDSFVQILRSPDDHTSISTGLVSEGGIHYDRTGLDIILFDKKTNHILEKIYSHKSFIEWEKIINERIEYYTQKKTLAGKIAHMSYASIDRLNDRDKGDFILDIGCGDGEHVKRLKNRETYIGLDRNLARLEILRERYPEANAIFADAANLPFKNGSIKYIFSSNAFEHIWYLKDSVFECLRVLDPEGVMVVVVPTEGGLWNLGRRLFSKPHFLKKYPGLDFELISHLEHCNNASQIIRTLETFFTVKKRFLPFRLPSVNLNFLIELVCTPRHAYGDFS